MPTRHCILSTCGTSLLTNGRNEAERKLVNKHSNAKQRSDVAPEEAATLDVLIAEVRDRLVVAERDQVARMSAELNALLCFYPEQRLPAADSHLLICTDTWLGEAAGELVRDWMLAQGCQDVQVHRRQDLQTADLASFQLSLSELVRWFAELLPAYQAQGYRIIFNLTGGFKSVQGFLQSLAPFYADEVVYIFESQPVLLRIPRLPVRMAVTETLREHLSTIRRLALELPGTTVTALPETLYLQIGDAAALSPWGELIWQQTRSELYTEQLWPSPSPLLVYGPRFADSVKKLAPDRLASINERIDDLSRFLEHPDHPNVMRLDFKHLKHNPYPPATHECDAWADGGAKRLFGHYEGERFVLDALDKHL